MNTTRIPVRIPITRADAYPHDDAAGTAIMPLDVTHLIVEVNVAQGRRRNARRDNRRRQDRPIRVRI